MVAHQPGLRRRARRSGAAQAGQTLQRYLALPSTGPLKTIAAWKAFHNSQAPKQGDDPRYVERNERMYDGLRKAGMPEE